MFNNLFKTFYRFNRSESGNVLIIIAFVMIVLIATVGAAVDMSRTNIVRQDQQNAIDAAENAANNFCTNDPTATTNTTLMQKCIIAQVDKYYLENTTSKIADSDIGTSLPSPVLKNTGNNGLVSLSSTATLDSQIIKADDNNGQSAIKTIIKTGVSNVPWRGVCDKDASHVGRCIIGDSDWTSGNTSWHCNGQNGGSQANCNVGGTGTPINGVCSTIINNCSSSIAAQNYDATNGTWDCPGANDGYTVHCGGNSIGICGVAAAGVLPDGSTGACNAGKSSVVSNYFSTTSGYQTWTCSGSGTCTNNTCTIPTPNKTHTSCATGFIGTGIDKVASCDPVTGLLIWTTNSDCTAQKICTPHNQISYSPCPTNFHDAPGSVGGITYTTPYTCSSAYGQPVEGNTTNVNNCVPNTPVCSGGKTKTSTCGDGYTGNKTETSYCTSSGVLEWTDWDVSQCKPILTCNPYTKSKVVSCPSGQYGTGIIQHQDYTCPNQNGSPVAGDWYNFDASGCSACQSMKINYYVRTRLGSKGFSFYPNDLQLNTLTGYINSGVTDCSASPNATVSFLGLTVPACVNSSQGAIGWFNNGNPVIIKESLEQIVTAYQGAKAANPALDSNNSYAVAQCPAADFVLLEDNIVSPVKVNLNGKNAALNSDRSMQFSMTNPDGSQSIITTYGSLNKDEAWLMIDANGNGLIHNGIVDGDDLFTDHNGSKENGYHDLAVILGSFIKQDESGRNFIPLRKLSDAEKNAEIEAAKGRGNKKAGALRAIDPSFDLKLLDSNNNELYASDYFDRIYTDYVNVSESDAEHHNIILERSVVRTLQGQNLLSADQWFVPKK